MNTTPKTKTKTPKDKAPSKKPIKEKIVTKLINTDITKEDLEKKYAISKIKTNVSIFSHLHNIKSFWWRVLVIIIVGMVGGLVSLFLVQNTGVYTFGLSGMIQGIARISKVSMLKNNIDPVLAESIYSLLFYGLYILINIPLLIFSWKKIGRKFTILTLLSIVTSNLFPFLLSLIPGVENVFLFGEVSPISPELEHISKNYGVYLLTFNNVDSQKFISLFIYTLIASVTVGVCYSLTLTFNASTGGLDIVSLHYSMKKNKSIGSMILYFNIATILFSVFVGSFLSAGIADGNFGYERFFSQNLISAIIYSLISSLVLNRLFPKNKLIKLTIYSKKIQEIREYLYSKNFSHSLTINNTIGGYSMQSNQNIEIICFYMELPKLLNDVQKADDKSLITITPIIGLFGEMSVKKVID
ncbi:MAG: YitT family protein [Malacoplasma sp.]